MNIPQIRIHSKPSQIEISSTRSELSIEQHRGQLYLEQPQADLNITRIPGKLTIDQTQARADVDLKSARRRIEEGAELGKQDVLAGIARRIREGEELMRIENGFGAIASIVKRNSQSIKEFGLGYIPKTGSVQISYDPGKVQIEVLSNSPRVNYQVNKPSISFVPSEVKVNLKQHASLEIDFVKE
ncbi:DUF6470 family protein [Robertmurraya sp. GLU-23]